MTPTQNRNAAAATLPALAIAELGFPVFPCVGKQPRTKNGFKDATLDKNTILHWWDQYPDANVAIPTDGLIVIDVDGRDNPWHGAGLDYCPLARTPRGGKHFIFKQPPGRSYRNTTSRLADHVDTRGDGGYILVTPSRTEHGTYRWDRPLIRRDQLPLPPNWLITELDALSKPNVQEQRSTNGHGKLHPYVQKALDAELGRVAMAREHTRNDTLNRAAFNLGQFVGGGYLDKALAENELSVAAQRSGLSGREVAATITSGLNAGMAKPREIPKSRAYQRSGHQHQNGVETATASTPRQSEAICLTDTGNGARLAHQHGSTIRHCHTWAKWLCWDGHRWALDDMGRIKALAKSVVLSLFQEAKAKIAELEAIAQNDPDNHEVKFKLIALRNLLAWALRSQAAARINAMLDLARSEPGIPIAPDKLDTDPWLLNVKNGTIDLRTGQLLKHDPANYITKFANVEYDPGAKCPTWEQFLLGVFQGAQSLIDYLQRLFGYCLTGQTTEHILPIFWGCGANGKSTLINVLLALLGDDYSGKASRDLLMAAKNDRHPTAMAWLHGKRFVMAMETEEGARLDEAVCKELTGGDPVTARRMREDLWTFQPTHKLGIVTNHRPEVRGTDHAIWRRLRLIPFTRVFAENEQDKDLPAKLKTELPGILAWCVNGCLKWQKQGLQDPPEVLLATSEYRTSQDTFATFTAERCVTGNTNYRVKFSELYGKFKEWCEQAGEKQTPQRRFGQLLRERGYESYTNNGVWYTGIAIRTEATEGTEGF